MTLAAATLWALGVTSLFTVIALITIGARPGAEDDFVSLFACQAAAYGLGLFGILRFHAPEGSIRELLGVRPTHPLFYVLAVLLGAALHGPASGVSQAIEARWPDGRMEDRLIELFTSATPVQLVTTGVVLVALGPIVEEVFFRGALLQPLQRRYGLVTVLVMTSFYFAAAHVEWRLWPPLILVGAVLGLLRVTTGSLAPAVLLHATFNGISFAGLVHDTRPGRTPTDETMPLWLVASGTAATILLLAAVHLLAGRSAIAAAARERDRR